MLCPAGKEVNETAIEANGDSAAVMGKELEYAEAHGIQFWSFCNYPIGCKEKHPPAAECAGIQCCADNVGLSYAWNQVRADTAGMAGMAWRAWHGWHGMG